MFFWFLGLSFVAVAVIFDSPSLDYRLVMAGAAVPTFEHLWGGPWITHALAWPVGLMTLIMVVARGRRLTQRRWLGLAIGFFMHLVLDGSWARTTLFWWPGFGWSLAADDVPDLPAVVPLVIMELAGLACLWWSARRWGLTDRDRLQRFARQGNLDRSLLQASATRHGNSGKHENSGKHAGADEQGGSGRHGGNGRPGGTGTC